MRRTGFHVGDLSNVPLGKVGVERVGGSKHCERNDRETKNTEAADKTMAKQQSTDVHKKE